MSAGVSVGIVVRLLVPYSPASTIGPYRTAWTAGSSGVASRVIAIGRVRSITSPPAQVRVTVANEPGVTLRAVPLITSWAPVAQLGIRTLRVNALLPAVIRSRVEAAVGKAVSWTRV